MSLCATTTSQTADGKTVLVSHDNEHDLGVDISSNIIMSEVVVSSQWTNPPHHFLLT